MMLMATIATAITIRIPTMTEATQGPVRIHKYCGGHGFIKWLMGTHEHSTFTLTFMCLHTELYVE